MKRIKCAVSNCEGIAFVAYGSCWICGKCMVKIIEKEKEEKQRRLLEL